MASLFKKNFYPFILLGIVILLFVANYKPGTYLSGWDNLQTELNPLLAIKRAFFAVWQEYQSFGLVGAMGHGADLVRAVFLWLVSFVLPKSVIRYFYHFLMLFLGGLGMWILLGSLGKSGGSGKLGKYGIVGGLFYMLNFGTIQLFFVPYEAFSTFFGFLPWLVWEYFKISRFRRDLVPTSARSPARSSGPPPVAPPADFKQNIKSFIVINILATPAFYVQTLFVIYIACLFCITLGLMVSHLIGERDKIIPIIKNSFIAFVLILAINSFWLLPQLYFLKTNGFVVSQSKINQLATEDVVYQNLEKGNWADFLKMEGFYYELYDNGYEYLFAPWRNHFDNDFFRLIAYVFLAIVVVGIIKSSQYRTPFLLILLLIMMALLGRTFPFSTINEILRGQPIIKEIFRSPFTKFAIPYSLVASYFLAVGVELIIKKIRLDYIVVGMVGGLIILYALPAFKGDFIAQKMKVKIPKEYFEVIDYFKNQDKNARIALLPDYTFWGWFHHRWGYYGSGFLWYGIEQPIVSRTFDVWNEKSEKYFWEMKRALESEDTTLVEQVLSKYDIRYVIYDYSLFPVSSSVRSLQYDRNDHMLLKSDKLQLEQVWDNFALFKRIDDLPQTSIANIGPKVYETNDDRAFLENGHYFTDPTAPFTRYYPFADFFTQTRLAKKSWQIREEDDSFIIETNLAINPNEYELYVPENDLMEVKMVNQKMSLIFAKEALYDFNLSDTKVNFCSPQISNHHAILDPYTLTISSTDGTTPCFGYDAPQLLQRDGYLVKLKNINVDGRRMFFYILDKTKRQAYLELRLTNDEELFIVAPRFYYGLGYTFVFHNNSYRNIESKNLLQQLIVYKLPYDLIKEIQFISSDSVSSNYYNLYTPNYNKKSYFMYQFNPSRLPDEPSVFMLPQSFDAGFKAYQFGKEIGKHVLVNNWANGWIVDQPVLTNNNQLQPITIIFWPQYLEFVGLIMVVVVFIVLIIHEFRTKRYKSFLKERSD